MTEYRIDDLARAAGVTVRNVRLYQERGLLPPPERRGRMGIYTGAHLARLRLIAQLLDRGYNYANIAELVTAWQQGRDLGQILGLEVELTGPWSQEIPDYTTVEELLDLFGDHLAPAQVPEMLERAIALGLLQPEGDRFCVPSPRLLHTGVGLVSRGLPLSTVYDLLESLREQIDSHAQLLVHTVAGHILTGHAPDWLPRGPEVPELAALLHHLRPVARMVVDVELAQAIELHLRDVLGDVLADRLTLILTTGQAGEADTNANADLVSHAP